MNYRLARRYRKIIRKNKKQPIHSYIKAYNKTAAINMCMWHMWLNTNVKKNAETKENTYEK